MIKLELGKATRVAYGEALAEVGKENKNVVVLDADLSKSTHSILFAKEEGCEGRFFNVGIAEANMASIAAGLALSGKKVFISSFASFLMCKAFDQIRVSISCPKLPVVIAGSHGGVSLGEDGYTQMAIEDLSLALALPNLYVLHPADEITTREFVHQLLKIENPAYLRLLRPASFKLYSSGRKVRIGEPEIIRKGSDITIFACGLLVSEALNAAEELSKEGIEAEVIDFHTLRPLNEDILYKTLKKTKAGLICEDHLIGGLSGVISLWASRNYPVLMDYICLENYAESASPKELYEKYGLNSQNIYKKAKYLYGQKNQISLYD